MIGPVKRESGWGRSLSGSKLLLFGKIRRVRTRIYSVVFLATLALAGCSPRVSPRPDPITARISKAYEASGIPVKPTDLTIASFDLLPTDILDPKAPGRPVWLVAIGAGPKPRPKVTHGLPYAYIDDATGNVSMILGTESIATPSQKAPLPEPVGARLKRAEANGLAWKALQDAGIPVGIHALSESRFITVKATKSAPEHNEWRIVFATPRVLPANGHPGPPTAAIDDRTGAVKVMPGK